jgi:DNA-binding SARP family transcriptional activator
MCQLQLSLFGVPIVKHGEKTLTFSTRKALALLVYLAVEGGVHPRKTLSESFWPELDAEHGRTALRATLFELRKLLDRSHVPGEQAHLLVERDTLGLTQDSSLLLDLRLVEAVSKRVGRQGALLVDQVDGALQAQLEQAKCLVCGPFLAGFTLRDSQFFDDWTRQQREYWHLRALQLFDALSRLYERAEEVEHALETVSRWLSFDPLDEEGYRRLMRLRFSSGDRVGALRAYTTCCEVLAHELELEPEPETVAMAKWIRCTAPVRLARTRSLEPLDPSPGQPATHLLDGPYLGRAAEFGSLTDCYRRVYAGQSHLVLLQGESGIGKTRLATEFLGWAQAQGAEVLMGKALHTGRQLPYQPLITVLRHHLRQEHTHDDLVSDVWLAELARLLPELRDRVPDLPVPTMDEALGHSGLFEATARLLQAWAARRPLVLLLDDMHWADTATRDLVLYLAQSLADRPAPILLLLTLRTGAETFPDPQSTWVMALKRTGIPLSTLGLAPFTQEETQRFIQALAWAEQQPEAEHNDASERGSVRDSSATFREQLASFAHWLYVQTRGQPFYLLETLKGLIEQEMIVPTLQQDGIWRLVLRSELLARTPTSVFIPSSVRELIRAQLGQLTPAAWALLVAGAVMGEGLTFERLCQVAQLDEETGVQALEEVLRRDWLCEVKRVKEAQACEEYIFAGEMIRAVVYQEAGTTRQRLVQRRVAALLQAEVEYDQGEEVSLPHPTPIDGHAAGETREEPQRRAVAGVGSSEISGMQMVSQSAVRGKGTIKWPRQMTRRHADTSIDKKTSLVAWERGAAVHSPSPFQDHLQAGLPTFLRQTEAERFSAHALSTIRKGGKLG